MDEVGGPVGTISNIVFEISTSSGLLVSESYQEIGLSVVLVPRLFDYTLSAYFLSGMLSQLGGITFIRYNRHMGSNLTILTFGYIFSNIFLFH